VAYILVVIEWRVLGREATGSQRSFAVEIQG
jgi:hypothetical protein